MNPSVAPPDAANEDGKLANTSIAESYHACATEGIQKIGRIRIDHSEAMYQTRLNKDFGRGHEVYASQGGVKEVKK